MSVTLPPAQQVVEDALAACAAASDHCMAIVEEASEVEVRFANNTTTTNGTRRSRRVTVISVRQVPGGVSAGVARRDGSVDVTELARAAERDASGTPPADDAIAPIGPSEVEGLDACLRRFGEPPAATDLSVLSGTLGGLSTAFATARRSGHVLAGYAEHHQTTTYLGTSTGLRLAHAQPEGALHLAARSADGSASSWVGAGTPDFADVSIDQFEAQLRRRLAWSSSHRDGAPGRYEVILPPEAVSDLMANLAFDAGGRDAEDGRTAFSRAGGGTRVDEQLTVLPFELRSDPAEPGLGCIPFLAATSSSADTSVFDNGLPLGRTEWLSEGRLRRLRYHRAGARRSGSQVTPFVPNLVLELPGASGTVEDLVSRTERGMLLTCLWYIREVDPSTMLVTGLTRDGVYVIEDGAVVGATTNFRFNESPVDVLARATEAGEPRRALGREFGEYLNATRMPPLRVPSFNMSSVSPAS